MYHYTDAAGFQGIAQSRELWASNAAFLNDSSELVYIREVLGVVTNDLMARYKHPRVRQFLTLVEPAFSDFVIKGFDFFLACFCVEPDQLSQWRGYPSAGGGYSIGFRTKVVSKAQMLCEVIYGAPGIDVGCLVEGLAV